VTVPPVVGGLSEGTARIPDSATSSTAVDSIANPDTITIAAVTADEVAPHLPLDTSPPIRAGAPAIPASSPSRGTAHPPAVPDPSPSRRSTPPDAAPRYPASEPGAHVRWARTWVNVRSERSGSSSPVRILDPGQRVTVDAPRLGWLRVAVEGVPLGYVDRSFLDTIPPGADPGR